MEKYGDSTDLPVEAKAVDTMPMIRIETDGGVDDGPPQAPAWNVTKDLMGMDTCQSEGEPTSYIWSQCIQGKD